MSKLQRKAILKKTIGISLLLLGSKFLGIIREFVQVSYLGVGSLSDAFNTAMKLPNLLRKLFAEGALSATFIPTITRVTAQESQDEASRLLTLTFGVFGGILLVICTVIAIFPNFFIMFIAQGFADKPIELLAATQIIRILIFFVFFVFASALLASAMQAKMHFTVPAWGPALLNVFYILGLGIGAYLSLSVDKFAYFLLIGGLVQLLLYAWVYFSLHFKILWPTKKTYGYFNEVLVKFFPYLMSVSIIEINLIIDNRFASTLPSGSLTLLSISSKFMTIALGAFAVAFSTILLPQFSRISTYAPRRLNFYLLESTKFIFWITIPVVLLMSFFSYSIFYTIFYKLAGSFAPDNRFTLAQVSQSSSLLRAFLPGLFFFSVNKILLNIYYALHETRYVMYITIAGAFSNILLNRLLMPYYGATGIALATALAAIVQTILLLYIVRKKLGVDVYLSRFGLFMLRYSVHLAIVGSLFLGIYYLIVTGIEYLIPQWSDFLLFHIGLWFWVGPFCLGLLGLLYGMRKRGSLGLYFLE